jgi:hypothetical protein
MPAFREWVNVDVMAETKPACELYSMFVGIVKFPTGIARRIQD